MNIDTFEPSDVRPISTHRAAGMRNPANTRMGMHRPRAVAVAMPAAAHLESLGLALLITAVASALPLVMMLHQ
ncbi:hypothetical protein [Methylocystis parvus]|uniref:hypothetical protein n=1 Tax=Methylocystis parvus TaxID=134 RepID=UPI003C790A58